MPDITALRNPDLDRVIPSGVDSLRVRRQYLRRRSRRNRVIRRTLPALWVGAGALLSWIFVVGFTVFAH